MEPEAEASERVSSAYKIISFPGASLPAAYRPVVYSRWLRTLRAGNDYFKLIDQDLYYSNYARFLDHILRQLNCEVYFAVLGDDADVVLGWSVYRGATLDYIHVQKDYRRNGIGKSLLVTPPEFISHLTKTGLTLWPKLLPGARFNPF